MKTRTRKNIRTLTKAGMIAALYVVLTWVSALFGLAGTNAVQLRLSEALCILPCFTAAAIPGVTVGCLLANLLTGALLPDIVFGTLATLLGTLGTYALRRYRYLITLPPILSNTLIIPLVLHYAYIDITESLPFLFATAFAGEVLSVGVLGTVLYLSLYRYRYRIFGENQ